MRYCTKQNGHAIAAFVHDTMCSMGRLRMHAQSPRACTYIATVWQSQITGSEMHLVCPKPHLCYDCVEGQHSTQINIAKITRSSCLPVSFSGLETGDTSQEFLQGFDAESHACLTDCDSAPACHAQLLLLTSIGSSTTDNTTVLHTPDHSANPDLSCDIT